MPSPFATALLFGAACAAVVNTAAQPAPAIALEIASRGGNRTSGLQYGAMFEDINNSGDGGIYAELISNRAFQATSLQNATTDPWVGQSSTLSIDSSSPLSSALPFSVQVRPHGAPRAGLTNPGFWGIKVKPQTYTGLFWVRGAYSGNFSASLESLTSGKVLASTTIPSRPSVSSWAEYKFALRPLQTAPDSNNTFTISFDTAGSRGSLSFNLVSLFPPTYKNRANGMRPDLMNLLAELNPSFLRIPGGNNLEGNRPPFRWIWNETIGPLTGRPGRPGTWNYYNTDGLGLAEYLDWCVDLHAEPILAVWAGLYLDGTVASAQDLQPYIDSVVDELEYVLGSTDTTFGKLRASHGHAQPWRVRFVEIGNEDNLWGGLPSYQAYRFKAFRSAIRAKYPDITVIASTPEVELESGDGNDYHSYTLPDTFTSQFGLFDQNVTGPTKTLIGEYAAIQPNSPVTTSVDWDAPKMPWPIWIGTVGESIFLLGAERNAGSIIGASYAPTLQNLNRWQWSPDLISFTADTSQDVRSTSHHLVKLFSETRFTETLPVQTRSDFGPAFWVAGRNAQDRFYGAKFAVYNSTSNVAFEVTMPADAARRATLTVLTAPEGYSHAEIGKDPVRTTVTRLTAGPQGFAFRLPSLSIAVLKTESTPGHPEEAPHLWAA